MSLSVSSSLIGMYTGPFLFGMNSHFRIRSGSMASGDRRPLPNTPVTNAITRRTNNRLGAVYSALHAFWQSRASAVTSGAGASGAAAAATNANARRDAYTVILFDHTIVNCIVNDFTRTPQNLLDVVLGYSAAGGTNFDAALTAAQSAIVNNWSTER